MRAIIGTVCFVIDCECAIPIEYGSWGWNIRGPSEGMLIAGILQCDTETFPKNLFILDDSCVRLYDLSASIEKHAFTESMYSFMFKSGSPQIG